MAEPSHALTRAAAEDSTTLAHAAVRAVTQAAEACEGMEVEPGISMNEALLDPVHRAQAARWRNGPRTPKSSGHFGQDDASSSWDSACLDLQPWKSEPTGC